MYDFRVSNDDSVDSGALLAWLAAGLDKRGKTQGGLAKVLGLSQPRISEILKGKRRIQATELPKIAEYIEQSPPIGWLGVDPFENGGRSDPLAKPRGEIRFGLHEDSSLVWVFVFRDDKLVDQFEANAGDLDNLSRQVSRAIQSLPKPK
jgi:transcriptional regulator with XRE-family HTH domain